MSKVQDLNDAIKRIDTDDYNKALVALGGKPVSQISYFKDYKPKRDVVEAQIRGAKENVGLVYDSLVSLDKKLEDAQSCVNSAIKNLASQNAPSETLIIAKRNLKIVQKNIAIIRSNIVVFKKLLNTIG